MAMNGASPVLTSVAWFESDISEIWNSLNCSMRQKISGGCEAM
jgi:hypothetical protein